MLHIIHLFYLKKKCVYIFISQHTHTHTIPYILLNWIDREDFNHNSTGPDDHTYDGSHIDLVVKFTSKILSSSKMRVLKALWL